MSYTISKVNGILTAEEARNQTTNNMSNDHERLLEAISGSIVKAIDDGKYYCFIYETLTQRVIGQISNLGYKVFDQSSYKDGEMYKIEW